MKKYLVLSEEDNSLTITNKSGTITSSVQYINVESCDKVIIPQQTKESLPNMSDYVLLRLTSGREIKLNFDEIFSPDFEDIDEMYSEIFSWIYGTTPPTPAP